MLKTLNTFIPSSSTLFLNLMLPTLGPENDITDIGIFCILSTLSNSDSAMSYALKVAKALPKLCPVIVRLIFSPFCPYIFVSLVTSAKS
ncbi:hypothetical protein HanIR_Chr12g0598381 [Helianthus annuus]|nr:hypothetical protein HanIR_Chr12g0598381 [Helianthus annuus]